MAKLDQALARLKDSPAGIRGSGDKVSDYPLLEKELLEGLPVCPAEVHRQPAPLEYIVERNTDGSLTVRCRVHGTHENLIYRLEDANQDEDLWAKAIGAERGKHETMLALSAVTLSLAPLLLFLAARLVLGKAVFAGKTATLKMTFSISYGLFLALGVFVFLNEGLGTFVKVLVVTSILSCLFAHKYLLSPDKKNPAA
ncbi:MAG TPA: hypothetical protein DCG57_01450 [Candidatus Riflebacteria bacterium]|nr:hypothetical protein [Candidatus Riflebacteria bacterium]